MTQFEGKAGCLFVRVGNRHGNPVPILYRWRGLNLETDGPVTVPGAGEGEAHVVLVDAKGAQVAEILLGHMADYQTATFPGGTFIRLPAAAAQGAQEATPAAEAVQPIDSQAGQ